MTRRNWGMASGHAKPCPVCGNDSRFTACSEQCAEDLCEIWIICRCGFDPVETFGTDRLESVMGQLTQENITAAFHCSWGLSMEEKHAS